jgi:hypothetical protein
MRAQSLREGWKNRRSIRCAAKAGKTSPGLVRGTADPLGFPRFPVQSFGFGRVHVVLLVFAGKSSEVGNPGTLHDSPGQAG